MLIDKLLNANGLERDDLQPQTVCTNEIRGGTLRTGETVLPGWQTLRTHCATLMEV